MIEVEVKIPIENIEKIKQKLLETGFIYQKTVVETDTYFTQFFSHTHQPVSNPPHG